MKAWLVVNGFLKQKKFDEIHQWLYEAGKNYDIAISIYTNDQLLATVMEQKLTLLQQREQVDFVIFWDKDILLAKTLEQMGLPVFNSSEAIRICDHKALTHIALGKYGIPMPDTIVAPMTYENIGYPNVDFLEEVMEKLGLPLVIKECFGSFGQQVYLCHTKEEVRQKVLALQGKPFIFQQMIAGCAGHDARLQVVGNKVVAAMERTAKEGDFRANITNGGTMKAYTPTPEEAGLAIRCCEILQADFAGVDILWDAQGKPLVCEVNSNAHFKNIYDCTGVNTAEHIMEHLRNRMERKQCTV